WEFGVFNRPWVMPSYEFDRHHSQNLLTNSSLMRRSVWESVKDLNGHGYMPDTPMEDWLFWLQASHLGFRLMHVGDTVLEYRRTASSRVDQDQLQPARKIIGMEMLRHFSGCRACQWNFRSFSST
ncbi:MAG: hypothetical protein ABIH46_08915, partial [Chloroflexota bacterium]